MASYSGAIPTFEANDDFALYLARFGQFCIANKVSDDKIKVALLLSNLDKDIYKTLHDLCYPADASTKDFTQITTLLKSHYSPVVNVHIERREFYRTLQQSEETCMEWQARLKRLSLNCSFGTSLDNVLRDKFVSGMMPGPILDRVVEEPITKTSEEIVTVARAKEMAIANSKNGANGTTNGVYRIQQTAQARTGGSSHGHQRAHTRTGSDNYQTRQQQRYGERRSTHQNGGNDRSRNSRETTRKLKLCSSCSRVHDGECRYSNFTCNSCGEKGHLQRACKQNRIN